VLKFNGEKGEAKIFRAFGVFATLRFAFIDDKGSNDEIATRGRSWARGRWEIATVRSVVG
jgi:hypothetical protein